MNSNTQDILDWGRVHIPDPKSRTRTASFLELGRASLSTGWREGFYLKHAPLGSVSLYCEPYTYTQTASLKAAAKHTKYFQYQAATLKVIFSNGSVDKSFKPKVGTPILANYQYTEPLAYTFSDRELVGFLPAAINYINGRFGFTYSYSGTINTFIPSTSGSSDKSVIARALAIISRKNLVDEQKRRGLGVKWRSGMVSIDTVAQLKGYEEETKKLEADLQIQVDRSDLDTSSNASKLNIYDENEVQS